MLSSVDYPWRARLWFVLTRGAVFFIAALLGVAVPAYYDATARVPPPEQWHVTQGTLTVIQPENSRHLGELSRIQVGATVFQCGGSWLQPSDCLTQGDRRQFADGQAAQVTWFAQPVFPGITRARVIALTVGDRVVIAAPSTIRRLQQPAGAGLRVLALSALGAVLMLLAGLVIAGAQQRWRKRQQALPSWQRR